MPEALCFHVVRLSVCASVRASVCDVVSSISMLCVDGCFHQIFVSIASWDKDGLIRFYGQKVKGQGHSMIKYTKKAIFGVCFPDISDVHWWIFSKLLPLQYFGSEMNWLGCGVKRSKVRVTAWPHVLKIPFLSLFPRYLCYFSKLFR